MRYMWDHPQPSEKSQRKPVGFHGASQSAELQVSDFPLPRLLLHGSLPGLLVSRVIQFHLLFLSSFLQFHFVLCRAYF